MIKSIQKIIRIGSSGGVTIPAKELKRQNLKFGDEVEVSIQPANKNDKHKKLMKEYEAFTTEYGETLKNLAKR
jgi:antitoxin component of MazEF toxin-antitoxin module